MSAADPDPSDRPNLVIPQRQLPLVAIGAALLLGVVFAIGVLIGRQLGSAALATPRRPPPGELAALDSASRQAAARAEAAAGRKAAEDEKASAEAEAEARARAEVEARVPEAPDAKAIPPDAGSRAKARLPVDDDAGEAAEAGPVAAGEAAGRAAATSTSPAPKKADPPKPDLAKAAATAAADEAAAARARAVELAEAKAQALDSAAARSRAQARAEARLAAEKEAGQPTAKEPATGDFAVQIGASHDREIADRVAARARKAGYAPYLVEAQIADKTWYRVRLGPVASREEAARLQTEASARLRVGAMIVPAR